MKTVGVRQLKERLGLFLRAAAAGETIVVARRGNPMVKIVPVAGDGRDEEAILNDLAKEGLLLRPVKKRLRAFKPPKIPNVRLTEALLENRNDIL